MDNVSLNVRMLHEVNALQGGAAAPVITTWLRNQAWRMRVRKGDKLA